MWRHKDWENPYPDKVKHPAITDLPTTRTMMHRAHEAGADAMLNKVNEALAPIGISFEQNGLYMPTRVQKEKIQINTQCRLSDVVAKGRMHKKGGN